MKKILAFVMAMAMVLGMSVTALADTSDPNNADGVVGTQDDRGTITIKNVEENVTIELYKIVEADYSSNGMFGGYKTTNPAYADILKDTTSGKVDYSTLADISADQINNLGVAKVESTKVSNVTFDYNGTDKTHVSSSLEIGMYLVVLTGSETTIYNYAVASIYYKDKVTGGVSDGSEITSDELDIENADLFAKSIDHPNITKKADDAEGNSVNIGDKIKYEVEITTVPYYNGANPVFKVVDTLSDGLTLDASDAGDYALKIEGYKKGATEADDLLSSLTDMTVTKENHSLTVDFVKHVTEGSATTHTYLLNEYAGGKIVITYYATLNDSAKINNDKDNNGKGNENDVKLSYTTDSKVDKGDDGDGEKEDKTYTYTFDIDGGVSGTDTVEDINKAIIMKTDGTIVWEDVTSSDTKKVSNPLQGAKFKLYTDSDCTTLYKRTAVTDKDGNVVVAAYDEDKVITSDENGVLNITGLAAGTEAYPKTYYLKEFEAPDGYTLNEKVFKIEIYANYYAEGETSGNIKVGQLKDWAIKIDNNEAVTFEVDYAKNEVTNNVKENTVITAIPNTKLSSLPSTGGIGTTIFTIGGCAIMILAAGLYFASRRKSAK